MNYVGIQFQRITKPKNIYTVVGVKDFSSLWLNTQHTQWCEKAFIENLITKSEGYLGFKLCKPQIESINIF